MCLVLGCHIFEFGCEIYNFAWLNSKYMPMRNLKLPKLKFRVADSDRSATAKFKVAKYKKPGVYTLFRDFEALALDLISPLP